MRRTACLWCGCGSKLYDADIAAGDQGDGDIVGAANVLLCINGVDVIALWGAWPLRGSSELAFAATVVQPLLPTCSAAYTDAPAVGTGRTAARVAACAA
jgi:hypothetical protein